MSRAQQITLHPLTIDNFGSFSELLGGDEFGGCFCAVWTHFDSDWAECCRDPEKPNLARTRADVVGGRRPGFLVEHAGEIIAWTGAGPKDQFPLLATRLGARASALADDTWCIGCLAIQASHRGAGWPAVIVDAVMRHARAAGAMYIEAFPTDPWDEPRSYRGALSMYLRLGFREMAREADNESHIVLVQATL